MIWAPGGRAPTSETATDPSGNRKLGDIGAFLRDNPAFAYIIEDATGLSWLTGFPDRTPFEPYSVGDPNAGIHALTLGAIGSIKEILRRVQPAI